tara:strand:- start:5294 stop:5677 length:384 start_codon:yes stop_codon:yes gene_type:complete
MSKASYQAHEEIKPKKLSIEQRIQIYLHREGALSLHSIARELELKMQTASARLSEMHDKGVVRFDFDGDYELTENEQQQQEVIKTRELEKRNKWMAQGVKNNYIEQIYAQVPEGGGQTEVRMIFNNE